MDRWSDMHPGVRVRVLPSASLPTRRWRRHRAIPGESQVHASAQALETVE
jgi:hypothetical protein